MKRNNIANSIEKRTNVLKEYANRMNNSSNLMYINSNNSFSIDYKFVLATKNMFEEIELLKNDYEENIVAYEKHLNEIDYLQSYLPNYIVERQTKQYELTILRYRAKTLNHFESALNMYYIIMNMYFESTNDLAKREILKNMHTEFKKILYSYKVMYTLYSNKIKGLF